MRYGATHKEETRKKVLKVAARAIRAQGPGGVAVADIMAKAGLTHGGFYAHFKSKDDLVAASLEQMFEEGRERMGREVGPSNAALGLSRYVDFYLSRAHRDSQGAGCPLPYLAADAARMDLAARTRFAEGVHRMTDGFARLLAQSGADDPDAAASSLIAEMVGALSLARADPDPARSDALLERSRAALKARFGLPATEKTS